tara:strand:- start:2835 stop:3740 length:906 start_codon:yes stop_codon:yes gene_type:complete
MNIGIYKKLITFLFIGFLSTFFGEIKAEVKTISQETVCKHLLCSNLEYPISFGGHGNSKERIGFNQLRSPNSENLNWHINYDYVLKLKSTDGNSLYIDEYKVRYPCGGFLGGCNNYLKLSKSLVIPSENIIYWGKYNFSIRPNFSLKKTKIFSKKILIPRIPNSNRLGLSHFDNVVFEIGYLSNTGRFKQYFITADSYSIPKDSFTSRFLKKVTKLNSGEVISDEKIEYVLLKLFNKNEKKLTIIQSIIKISKDVKKNCIEADGTKFPDLIKEYKDLSKTINPLRAKLDLPPSTDLKPICN